MNIKHLEGKVFANYKELCDATGLKYTTGGRNFRLTKLSRYAKIEKHGWKYHIVEVYDTPREEVKGQISCGVVTVVNRNEDYTIKNKKPTPMQFKGIVINKDDYEKAIKILQENGIEFF